MTTTVLGWFRDGRLSDRIQRSFDIPCAAMQDTLDAYAAAATPAVIATYDGLPIEAIHEHVIDLFP